MDDTKFTLKEMCAKFDLTPRTLRYYEYLELIAPEKQGRSRLYGPRECARVQLIRRGRRFGFSLEELRQWLELYDEDPLNRLQMEKWIEMSSKQIIELENRQRELTEVIDEMARLRSETIDALGKLS
ncbi:MAG TPA: MerR family DNA-binding transcriptional regulator [Paracoccaceae bacterium]|nr:MerR family DNA-binding transcriptional regulator [Paracoccaceae bacterium]